MERAKLIIADTIGVAIAGWAEPEMKRLGALRREPGGSSTLARGFPTTSPRSAAFSNATAASFLELDQGARPTGHPALHVLPATLAYGQAIAADGRDVLLAFLVGYEVQSRIQSTFTLRWPAHPHGNLGHPAAAAALARLRGWPTDAVLAAVEVGASFASATSWGACFDGATTRNAFAGLTAEAAMTAVELVDSGFSAPESAVDDTFGVLLGDATDLTALSRGLGMTFGVDTSYFKFHAACALAHSSLDATFAALGATPSHGSYPLFVIARDRLPDPREVVGVTIEVPERAARLARDARGSSLSAKFSISYAVAAAIVSGTSGPATFREPYLSDPQVQDVARKVSTVVADDLSQKWPNAFSARVVIDLADGTPLAGFCESPYGNGSPADLSADLRAKFGYLTHAALGPTAADALWGRLTALEDLPDVSSLFEGLGDA